MRFGLSVLAKFLVAPETLPLGVYNTLAEKAPWVHTGSTSASIQVQTLLLGQEDQDGETQINTGSFLFEG